VTLRNGQDYDHSLLMKIDHGISKLQEHHADSLSAILSLNTSVKMLTDGIEKLNTCSQEWIKLGKGAWLIIKIAFCSMAVTILALVSMLTEVSFKTLGITLGMHHEDRPDN